MTGFKLSKISFSRFFQYKYIQKIIWPCRKVDQGQLRITSQTHIVNPTSTMLHTRQKQSDMGLHCLFRPFWQVTSVQNFRSSTVLILTIDNTIDSNRGFSYICGHHNLPAIFRSSLKYLHLKIQQTILTLSLLVATLAIC